MKKIIIVCNAIDDVVRSERNITTDSPAASRKVFMLADTLADTDVHVDIVSMGRGKANGGFKFYNLKKIKKGNVNITYLPFTHIRFFSELLTFLYLAIITACSIAKGGYSDKAVIFYNRLPAYILSLFVSVIFRAKRIIDIEDGEIVSNESKSLKNKVKSIVPWLYDTFCKDGAMLACSALSSMTKIEHTTCYYGTVSPVIRENTVFDRNKVSILLSGSLSEDTGAERLSNAIRLMRSDSQRWRNVQFEISGQGPSLQSFQDLMNGEGFPAVRVHGRLSNSDYHDLLVNCDVGLALKPIIGSLANTTFPSKVVEYANSGLLVISTDISDVRHVLGADGAIFLSTDSEDEIINAFDKVIHDTAWSRKTAEEGKNNVLNLLAPERASNKLMDFIFRNS
ncbi:glycosyl transferase family 1 [Pectobacterium polaris]|uniref:glycosyltransferase n=1 Tax=Pectobacterium polaris TaxID=2042057 RepID=UPI000BAC8E1B|nr:glycosyltransferase [Pectobacterium polaris]ASY78791.1 glycosyl transferase family 1 [Pectobacterium polaris]MCA6942748.1 glycosyltransferase [Pectobacterium polaris]